MATNTEVLCGHGKEELQGLEDKIQRKANQIRIITKEIGSIYHEPSCCHSNKEVVKNREANMKFLQRLEKY